MSEMNERKSVIERKTAETDIKLSLNIDGSGKYDIKTGSGFFDHMLTLFAAHGSFDISVCCAGDTDVDFHHSAEDIGICMGKAFSEAAGDKRGIKRYADILLPMDEALILAAVDISGRSYVSYDAGALPYKVGSFDTELAEEFLNAFVRNFPITLHIKKLSGTNAHHILEGIFKASARILREALSKDVSGGGVPSTKGVL